MIAALLAIGLSLASAQNNPTTKPVAFRDFSGGYVDNVDPVNLNDNESPDLLNVVVDDPVGSLKPRKGYILCGNLPSGNVATQLYEYSRSDGTRRLIASDNQNVYTTPDCQNWTTIVSGMSASAQVYFATIRDKLWIVNGSTWPATWDGTTYTLLDGRANTPNPAPPKCSFIEFWKERVWCGAPVGDPSGLDYSALTDTSGNDLDPSTGTLSWPASNNFEIDNNAGSRIYGIKAYHNRLYVFKDNGIWEVGFNNDFDNFVRKTFASVGSRYQTSIVEVDGILYFIGKDGIYSFDGRDTSYTGGGQNAVRVSAKIKNKFESLNQPLISQNYRLWSVNSDFDLGTFVQATDNDAANSVTLTSAPAIVSNGDFESGALSPFTATSTTTYTPPPGCTFTPTPGITNGLSGSSIGSGSIFSGGSYVALATTSVNGVDPGADSLSGSNSLYLYDTTGSTLTTVSPGPSPTASTYTLDTSAWIGKSAYLHWSSNWSMIRACGTCYDGINGTTQQRCSFNEAADITSPKFTVGGRVTFQQAGCTGANCAPANGGSGIIGWTKLDEIQDTEYLSTGSWTSEIYNAIAVSTWGPITITDSQNGGSISYDIRYGTNTGAVQEMAFQPITSGALIPAATNQIYVQLKANLGASADLTKTPSVYDLQIAWNSGGANTQKIYSSGWQNSLWISASSGTSSTNNLVIRRARAPLDAWTLHDLQIGPMTSFNDLFYAASSTDSAIYRMDYGTNDYGKAITWYWESKDENYGLPNNAKYLTEVDADYRNDTACNLRIGYMQDKDTTACVGNAQAFGSGVGSRRLLMNGGPAYTYRFKVCDDQLDQSGTIIGLTGWSRAINVRGQ